MMSRLKRIEKEAIDSVQRVDNKEATDHLSHCGDHSQRQRDTNTKGQKQSNEEKEKKKRGN